LNEALDIFLKDLGSGFSKRTQTLDLPLQDCPDYVSRMARFLLRCGHEIDPSGDPVITRCMEYYREWAEVDLHELIVFVSKYSDIYQAHQLRLSKDDARGRIIEAGILGRATNEQIAEYVGCAKEVVDAYELLFFNVRPRLENEGYIFGLILNAITGSETQLVSSDAFWKFIAYRLGWEQFKLFYTSRELPEALEAGLRTCATIQDFRRMLMARYVEPVNYETAGEILKRSKPILQLEFSESGGDSKEYEMVQSELARLSSALEIKSWGSADEDEHEDRYLPEGFALDNRIIGEEKVDEAS